MTEYLWKPEIGPSATESYHCGAHLQSQHSRCIGTRIRSSRPSSTTKRILRHKIAVWMCVGETVQFCDFWEGKVLVPSVCSSQIKWLQEHFSRSCPAMHGWLLGSLWVSTAVTLWAQSFTFFLFCKLFTPSTVTGVKLENCLETVSFTLFCF